jgi:transcriptional regulator with XRE-family HTH domain
MSAPLANYLLTHRKRMGFSQAETAALLGFAREDVVSRFERGARKPSLETALAYEAIFGIPAKDLFAGVYRKVEKATRARALLLASKLSDAKSGKMISRKLLTLELVASRPARSQSVRP